MCKLIMLLFFLKVIGTPTREENRSMNPKYIDFRFPKIKAAPRHKICILFHFELWNCHMISI